MGNGSNTDVRKVLQDTFAELQSQLEKRRLEEDVSTGSFTEPEGTRQTLEEAVTDLARKAGFEVVNVLGMGGMGAVVKAVDIKLKRTVAMKFLPPDLLSNKAKAAQLRKEAEIASRIQHENVVQILSFHEVDNVPFFAMEFIEGETVDDLVRRRGKLPAYEALRITGEAARGLEALHASDIIHRDIKPQNILIARDGRVKIADFGISLTNEQMQEEAQFARIAGTPKFMSPEQARGEAAHRQSDIYSLGATLYYMLSGRSPVEGANDIRLQLDNVRQGRVVPITQLLPKLDKRVAKLVMRSLHLNVSRRPFDSASFRKELEEVFIGQKGQSSGGLGELVQRYWRLLVPIATLAIGALIGFKGAEWSHGPKPPANAGLRISTQAMNRIAQSQLVNLRQLAMADPAATEANQLAERLQQAIEGDDEQALAGLLPAADRYVRRWEITRLLNGLSRDQRSPQGQAATLYLARLESATPTEVDDIMRESRELWYASLAGKTFSPQSAAPPP